MKSESCNMTKSLDVLACAYNVECNTSLAQNVFRALLSCKTLIVIETSENHHSHQTNTFKMT